MRDKDAPWFSLFHLGVTLSNLNKRTERQLGLSLGQWCLLKHLIDMPGTSAFSLAKAAGVHPSTLTQMLKRLQRKGLILIGEDSKDSRKKLISVTRQGKAILDKVDVVMNEQSRHLAPLTSQVRRLRDKVAERIASFH